MNINKLKSDLKTLPHKIRIAKWAYQNWLRHLHEQKLPTGYAWDSTPDFYWRTTNLKLLREFQNLSTVARATQLAYAFTRNKPFPEKWFYDLPADELPILSTLDARGRSIYCERVGNQGDAIRNAKILLGIWKQLPHRTAYIDTAESLEFDLWIRKNRKKFRPIATHKNRIAT